MSDTAPAKGRFPKFIDTHKEDWKKLLSGKNPEDTIWFRVVSEDVKKIDIAIKARKRETAVGRNIRSLLDQFQNKFGLQNAGVSMYGGPIPLYNEVDGEAGDKIEAYEQNYRYTKRIV